MSQIIARVPGCIGFVEHLHDYAPPTPPAAQRHTVPAGQLWHVLQYAAQYDADGTGVNRTFELRVFDAAGGNAIWSLPLAVTLAPGATQNFNGVYNPAAIEHTVNNVTTFSMPDLWLAPGAIIDFVPGNASAGDQYHGFTLNLQRWIL